MNLKVIKPIKGLVDGDILYYNQDQDQYEITKIDEEIGDTGTSRKTLKVIIGSWLVDTNKEFFKYVDDEGNDITIEEFKYGQKEEDKVIVDTNSGELEVLRKENEELKNKFIELEGAKWIEYNEWKNLKDWYIKRESMLGPMFSIFRYGMQ
jgi:hypothetical protein